MINKIIFSILFLSGFGLKAQSVTINATTWNVSATHNLVAGTDYINTEFVSNVDQTRVNVATLLSLLAGFRVFVHREGSQWNPNLKLYVRRTGNGTIGGVTVSSLQNGTTFMEVLTTSTEFFRYVDTLSLLTTISNIPIQYGITGVSVTLPVATYTTTVVYTVVGGL